MRVWGKSDCKQTVFAKLIPSFSFLQLMTIGTSEWHAMMSHHVNKPCLQTLSLFVHWQRGVREILFEAFQDIFEHPPRKAKPWLQLLTCCKPCLLCCGQWVKREHKQKANNATIIHAIHAGSSRYSQLLKMISGVLNERGFSETLVAFQKGLL